jgi:hypothetical protein
MGKRRGKPFNPAKITSVQNMYTNPGHPEAELHDRRARDEDLLRNAQVAPMEVIDPLGLNPGDKIQVLRSLRNDPLAVLHNRDHIDSAQYQGGRGYQRDWELAERGPRAIDPAKEYVSGGLAPEGITDAQIEAVARLTAADAKLGHFGAILAGEVLVEGMNLSQVAKRRGLSGDKWEKYFGKRFRECLEALALVYGQTNRTKKILDLVE